MKNNQSGRSMIEMLCVLSIIGVLTVGAMAGYRKMVSKYYANKTAQYITGLVADIKTGYAQQENYDGIMNDVVMGMGVLPPEFGTNPAKLKNPWGGYINIFASDLKEVPGGVTASEYSHAAVVLEFGNISRETCMQLMTQDWASRFDTAVVALVAGSGKDGKKSGDTTNVDGPITEAGGKYYSGKGADTLYLNDTNTFSHSDWKKLAFGVLGNKQHPIPVKPADAATGCACYDPETQESVDTCSIAIKFH